MAPNSDASVRSAEDVPPSAAQGAPPPPHSAVCPATTLYEVLGGHENVKQAVQSFYSKVLADPLLAPFFEGINVAAQRRKQVMFLSYALGGPEAYRGRDLWAAHKHMVLHGGLGHAQFDAVKHHLAVTLEEMGVAQEVIQRVAAVVESTRGQFRFPDRP